MGAFVAAQFYVRHTQQPCYLWCFPNVPVEHITEDGQRYIVAPTYYVTKDFILGQASVVTKITPDRFQPVVVGLN